MDESRMENGSDRAVVMLIVGFGPIPLEEITRMHSASRGASALQSISVSDSLSDDDTVHRREYNDYDYRGRPEGNRLARFYYPVEQTPTIQRTAHRSQQQNTGIIKSGNQHAHKPHQTNSQKRQYYGARNQGTRGGRQ